MFVQSLKLGLRGHCYDLEACVVISVRNHMHTAVFHRSPAGKDAVRLEKIDSKVYFVRCATLANRQKNSFTLCFYRLQHYAVYGHLAVLLGRAERGTATSCSTRDSMKTP